jgi:hypothetical protein
LSQLARTLLLINATRLSCQVQQFDARQPPFGDASNDDSDEGFLPPVKHVLQRWWNLKVGT